MQMGHEEVNTFLHFIDLQAWEDEREREREGKESDNRTDDGDLLILLGLQSLYKFNYWKGLFVRFGLNTRLNNQRTHWAQSLRSIWQVEKYLKQLREFKKFEERGYVRESKVLPPATTRDFWCSEMRREEESARVYLFTKLWQEAERVGSDPSKDLSSPIAPTSWLIRDREEENRSYIRVDFLRSKRTLHKHFVLFESQICQVHLQLCSLSGKATWLSLDQRKREGGQRGEIIRNNWWVETRVPLTFVNLVILEKQLQQPAKLRGASIVRARIRWHGDRAV